MDLHGRNLLKEIDLTAEEFGYLIDLAARLRADKRAGRRGQRLMGLNIALIFEKASTRTRSAFEVATHDEGGHTTYMGPDESHIGPETIVVCAGGGGIPVVRDDSGALRGVEAVVDKDLTASLLARMLAAEALVILTDVDAAEDGYGTPQAQPIRQSTPRELRARSFPAGSMGPKIEAEALVEGKAGTIITRSPAVG